MSGQLLRPGLKFTIFPLPPKPTKGLARTPSTYRFGSNLETWPVSGEEYIVCADMTVRSVLHPEKPVGWELVDENDTWYFRVTQHGFTNEKCDVRCLEYMDEFPKGTGTIGSVVKFAYSRAEAMMIDFDDDGEPEVTSKLS